MAAAGEEGLGGCEMLLPARRPELELMLGRFIDAKGGDESKGAAKAMRWLHWAQSAKPWEARLSAAVRGELLSGKVMCLAPPGDGRAAVYLLRPALHFAPSDRRGFPRAVSTRTAEALYGHAMHGAAEQGPAAAPAMCVVDLQGYAMANVDRGVLRELGQHVAKYFPGVIEPYYVVNPPTLVWGLWMALRPFVAAKWRARIHFVQPGELPALLGRREADLPAELGGALVVDPAAWLGESAAAICEGRAFDSIKAFG